MSGHSTLDRVIFLAHRASGISVGRLNGMSAVDQDLGIAGDDVADFAGLLAAEFGEWVWTWPWHRFAILGEGLSIIAPFMAIWRIMTWPLRATLHPPESIERLELGHIAVVIDAGEWRDP